MKRSPETCIVCEQLLELTHFEVCATCNELFLEYEPATIRRRMQDAMVRGDAVEHERHLRALTARLRVEGIECPLPTDPNFRRGQRGTGHFRTTRTEEQIDEADGCDS